VNLTATAANPHAQHAVDTNPTKGVHSTQRPPAIADLTHKEAVMRMLNATKSFFHAHKPGAKPPEDPSIFETGIGEWLLDAAALALIALVVGTLIRWAYLAISR
jgi:hypothetical protein